MTRVKVRVPPGAAPGDTLEFALSSGRSAYFMVPKGAKPGAVISINTRSHDGSHDGAHTPAEYHHRTSMDSDG